MGKRLKKNTKDTINLGIVSIAGLGTMGVLGSVPGMPSEAGKVVGIAGSGLALANVGQLANTGLGLTNMMKGTSHKRKNQNGGNKNGIIKKNNTKHC